MRARTLLVGLLLLVTAAWTAQDKKSAAPAKSANENLLRSYVDAWNHHDSAAFDRFLGTTGIHEDLAEGFTGHGATETRAFMTEVTKTQPDYKWTITKIIENGNNVVAEWTWTSTYSGPGPNGPVQNVHIVGRGASVVEVEKGKIKRFTDYYDNASFFPKADSPAKQ
jgi:steroid delta-isomerase-like uncharacterized protein